MRDPDGYRDVLESLLSAFDGRHWLHITEVARFFGMDNRTVKEKFGFGKEGISAEVLARRICKCAKN